GAIGRPSGRRMSTATPGNAPPTQTLIIRRGTVAGGSGVSVLGPHAERAADTSSNTQSGIGMERRIPELHRWTGSCRASDQGAHRTSPHSGFSTPALGRRLAIYSPLVGIPDANSRRI